MRVSLARINEQGNDHSWYEADRLGELLEVHHELNWTIEHCIEANTLTVLVGPEGSFKSFLAIDWCMAIATGRDWRGNRVRLGRVLYIAGEGHIGVIRRMRGWCDHYQETEIDNVLLGRGPIQLLELGEAERVAKLGKFDLVVVDTLARNFGSGSENDQKDMTAAVQTADEIRDLTGAAVLLVHHTPLEGRLEGRIRPRGSSVLSGAVDAIFTTQYDKDSKVITIMNTKQKDAQAAETMYLSYEAVDLGQKDNFGNVMTTVVLCPTHKRPARRRQLGKNQKRLIQILVSLAGDQKGEVLVESAAVSDALQRTLTNKQRRADVLKWMREQDWAKETTGGYSVDIDGLPRG